jgi:hypothetical protein
MQLDLKEITVRLVKYLIEGLVVAICAYLLPAIGKHRSTPFDELLMLGLVAACTFSILDLFSPSISQQARGGAGLGIGIGLVGGLPMKAM